MGVDTDAVAVAVPAVVEVGITDIAVVVTESVGAIADVVVGIAVVTGITVVVGGPVGGIAVVTGTPGLVTEVPVGGIAVVMAVPVVAEGIPVVVTAVVKGIPVVVGIPVTVVGGADCPGSTTVGGYVDPP